MPDLTEAAVEVAFAGGVLFIDEIHAAPRRVRDALLVALDPGLAREILSHSQRQPIPACSARPLRRRFALEIGLQEYTVHEAEELTKRRTNAMGLPITPDASFIIARAARANPARVSRLLLEARMLVEGTADTLDGARLQSAPRRNQIATSVALMA